MNYVSKNVFIKFVLASDLSDSEKVFAVQQGEANAINDLVPVVVLEQLNLVYGLDVKELIDSSRPLESVIAV